jgi:hypothetical protein
MMLDRRVKSVVAARFPDDAVADKLTVFTFTVKQGRSDWNHNSCCEITCSTRILVCTFSLIPRLF